MENDNGQGNGPPGSPPAGLHFLKALGHGAMAFGHLMFGQPDEESDEEATAPRRRRRVATGRRGNGSGSCCSGRRR